MPLGGFTLPPYVQVLPRSIEYDQPSMLAPGKTIRSFVVYLIFPSSVSSLYVTTKIGLPPENDESEAVSDCVPDQVASFSPLPITAPLSKQPPTPTVTRKAIATVSQFVMLMMHTR